MKRCRVLIASIVSIGCAGAPPASPPSEAPTHEAPQGDALRQLLAPEHGHLFTNEDMARGCPEGSLGAYLALLEDNTRPDPSEPSRIDELTFTCGVQRTDAMWPAGNDATHWACTVMAESSDAAGESPWRYELRFLVRRDDGRLDPSYFACPGAG